MFSRMKITKSTENYWDSINKLKDAIDNADAIIIGAGAGLSTAAEYSYSGERFERHFSDFKNKYGIIDMYSGGFYPFKTLEEYWAWWSRHIYVNRYIDEGNDLYKRLFDLVKHKEYFVFTTNVDHLFQRNGFDKDRLFYTQGDYGLFQCSVPCCNETFDNEKLIKLMYYNQRNMKIPTDLIPLCPHCYKPMTVNLRCDDTFIQDSGWYKANERYNNFISKYKKSKILFLELGVGYNTPVIIKYPFWKFTSNNKNAIYSCVNLGEAYFPSSISDRAISINADINKVINDML